MIVCRFSSLRSWTSIDCAYCVAIMLIYLNVLLIFMIRSLSIAYGFFIDGMCVVPLAPATNTMSGATFHPLVMMLLMSNWCFMVFLLRVSTTHFSLQYEYYINCMLSAGAGGFGGGWLYE